MSPIARIALTILLAAPTLYAQETEPVPPPNLQEPQAAPKPPVPVPPLPRGRVTGSVLCADTRQPARGATVLLWAVPAKGEQNQGDRTLTVHVNATGTYTFEHVPAGEYIVIGLFPGYLSPFDDLPDGDIAQGEAEMVKLVAARGSINVSAESSSTANIVLERGAAISGRVLYSDGSPATQVTVSLEDTAKTPTHNPDQPDADFATVVRTLIMHQSLVTDDLGRFRVSGIKPGRYRVAASPPSGGDDGNDNGERMAFITGMFGDPKAMRVYSGDTIHKKDARKYDLRPGDEITGLEIRLPIDGFHSVRGLVNAVDGRPVNLGSLTLTDTTDDAVIFYANLATDGTFHFSSVPSGTYTLEAKGAKIGAMSGDAIPQMTEFQRGGLVPTNAFADGTTPVLIKDSDLNGVVLSLTEIPMPKEPANPTPDPTD